MDEYPGVGFWLSGWILAIFISAIWWKSHRIVQMLPIAYSLCVGMVYGLIFFRRFGWYKAIEALFFCGLLGLIGNFSVWVDSKDRWARKDAEK